MENNFYDSTPERQNPTTILTLGIVSLALCWTGLIGLICGIVCRVKIGKYKAEGKILEGKTKVGNILSIIGIVISSIYTVYWGFILAFGFIATILG